MISYILDKIVNEMLGNIIVVGVLAVILFFVIRGMVKRIKSGKSICGCDGDCSKCNGCK